MRGDNLRSPVKPPSSKLKSSRKSSKAKASASAPLKVFYSYSHKDERLRERLEVYLATLRRENRISEWHDRRITPAKDFEGEISANLEHADIILLLVSQNFIASDYIYDKELKRAMERHEASAASVVPIILSPCDWKTLSFGKLQVLPRDGRPVTTWSNEDEAFLDIAIGIRAVVEYLTHAPN